MARWILALSMLVSVANVAGCVPKKIAWSPDGKRAAVVTKDDSVELCDADGKLLGEVTDHAASLTPVTWFGDSQRLLVVRKTTASKWAAAKSSLSEGQQTAVIETAKRLREEVLSTREGLASFKPSTFDGLTPDECDAVLLYLSEQSDMDWPEASEHWHDWSKEHTVDVTTIELFESTDGAARRSATVVGCLAEIMSVRLSPDGKHVAYVRAFPLLNNRSDYGDERRFDLYVASIADNRGERLVTKNVAAFPDWTPDNKSLVYATSAIPDENEGALFGAIVRTQVASEQGLLDTFGDREDLAGVLFNPWQRVCCLRDGRILFASTEVQLPTTAKDMPQQASLFVLDPKHQATVARVLPHQAEIQLPDGLALGSFELSPDETRLAVAGEYHEVAILTLADGEVTTVFPRQPNSGRNQSATLPTWRSNEELCFAVPAGSELGTKDRAEVVLWSNGEVRCISKEWPTGIE